MQILILAAGMGNRLRPLTDEVPKVMVKIGGKEMIKHQLDLVTKLPDVSEIIIVVGYKKELIKSLIGKRYHQIKIKYVENNNYKTTNNVYSVHLALKHIKENTLLLEGDVIFKPCLLKRIVRDKNTVFVEKFKPYMDGGVVEIDENSKIKRLISKQEQQEGFKYDECYKTVNIYHFTYNFISKYYKPALSLYIKAYGKKDYYELVIGSLVYMKVCSLYAEVLEENMLWFEIDDLIDLSYAEHLFLRKDFEFIKHKYGGYWNYNFVDFCYLYNVYFPSPKLAAEITANATELINSYPSGQQYNKLLLSSFFHHRINLSHLFVGNGASEIITILNHQLIDSVTIPVPTFDEYLTISDKKLINQFVLSEKTGFQINVEALIKSARKTNYLVLVNPNNPTGQCLTVDEVAKVLNSLKKLKGIILDESFIDFSDEQSALGLVDKYKNLIYLKSISKSYGVPGIRLGFVYTKNKLALAVLNRYLPIWNINSFAEKFMEKFGKFQDDYLRSLQLVKKDRLEFTSKLEDIGLKVFPSQANFLLCQLPAKSISNLALTAKLFAKDNIYIKDLNNKMGSRYLRLTVRKPADNEKLINALEKYL